LDNVEDLDPFEFIRTIAVARILMPKSYGRLSAGRQSMNDQTQALCFLAGANSIFYGEKLLTTPLPDESSDLALFARLGMRPEQLAARGSAEKSQSMFYSAVDSGSDNRPANCTATPEQCPTGRL